MPWVALAPRAWPPPRPRLRLVKADPPNPYLSWNLPGLEKEKAALESLQAAAPADLKSLWAADLALLQEALSTKQPPSSSPTPAPTTPNPYAGLTPSQLKQVQSGLQQAIASPLTQGSIPKYQADLALVEQQMMATGLMPLPPVLSSVQQWEKLMDLAQAAAPKMQEALTSAFDWPKLPSGVQQSLVQGQVAQALGQMADFGMQQMEASYVPAFSELAEQMFTEVAAAQWPALRQTLLQTGIPQELPTKLPDDLMVQRALRYVRTEGLTRAKNLWIPTIEASREIIRAGLAEGKTTPTIARELRQHIGLLPGQAKQLNNYTYGLAESGVPQDKIETLSEKFAAKLLRRRTTVIARTETAAALNVAADTFFEAAKDAANLPETALRRFWLITFDGRTCPICRAIPEMNEDGKLFQEPFMTPTGAHMRPPSHPQCRCVVIVRPTMLAAPGMAVPPLAPAPTVLPAPEAFPVPPPKAKKPAKPKKPTATPAPRAKPLKATEQIELTTAKGELLRDLGGSTGAKQYRGTDGVERAVKGPKTQQAYQEFVANKLYRELGIEAPDQKLVMDQGKIAGVASTWEAGTQTLERAGLTQERARGVLKGFVADVWLANRDAVGLTMDNILVKGDRLIRIDNGGSLMFRAQGSLKNKADLDTLGEWQGLQSRALNRAYADVFQASGYGTPENIPDLVDQVQALQALRDRTNGFSDLVPAAPGISAAQRREVVTLLQKRARLLEEQVGLVAQPAVARNIEAEKAALQRYLGASRYSYDVIALQSTPRPAGMHEHEAVAIYEYTGNAYTSMNSPFWSERDAATRARERQERAPIIDAAQYGLPKLEPGKEGTYYRGVRELSADYSDRMSVPGAIVELEGFASTSSKKQVAVRRFHGDRHLFVIKGHGGNYNVMPISQLGTSEAEYLYPPNARFRVVGPMTEDPLTRAKVFHLEEVPEVQKRQPLGKQGGDETYPQPDPWPEDYDIWTDAQKHAWALGLLKELDAHVYTEDEKAAAAHFSLKQESAHTVPQEPTT